MISALDICRTANVLVKEYSVEQAPQMAAKRCDALLDLGDVEGPLVWKGVPRAVQEITRTEREAGLYATTLAVSFP